MSAIASVKSALRKDVKARLKLLSPEELESRSAALTSRLKALPVFAQSRAVCCYLSMPTGEARTSAIVQACFAEGKRLFIPKVTGKEARDMRMLEVVSEAQLAGFPQNAWGIPEPPLELAMSSPDAAELGVIDLVIMPGVAFDAGCNRLGHGKGYYDCFLERLLARATAEPTSSSISSSSSSNSSGETAPAAPRPALVGLAFDEQLVDSIPHEPHDQRLDVLITPTQILYGSK